jgi:hypothetical protein
MGLKPCQFVRTEVQKRHGVGRWCAVRDSVPHALRFSKRETVARSIYFRSVESTGVGKFSSTILFACAVAFALTACSGGDDRSLPDPAQTANWRSPQVAPASVTALIGVYSDGRSGAFVVGRSGNDDVLVLRYDIAAGWSGATTEMRGLQALQAVRQSDGVALFGRDATMWFRTDFSATGVRSMQPQFPVEYRDSDRTAAINHTFTPAFDGAIVATAVHYNATTLTTSVQTREYRQGSWSAAGTATLTWPDGGVLPPIPLTNVALTRSRAGDVVTVFASNIYTYTFVAIRRSTDAAYVAVTDARCVGARCSANMGAYAAPILELDGSASVMFSRFALSQPDDWFAVRSSVPAPLWQGAVMPGNVSSSPATRRLRVDGSPLWLTVDASGLVLWDGAQRAQWTGDAAALASCDLAFCAQISAPDTTHLATLQGAATGSPVLYVADRSTDGRWSSVAAVPLSPVATAMANTRLVLDAFHANGPNQVIVGVIEPQNYTPGGSYALWPFAVSKR